MGLRSLTAISKLRQAYFVSAALALLLLVAGCFSPSSPFSTGTRPSPADAQVDPADLEAVVAGNSDFAFDLFHQLGREDGNLVFSPYGITQVLAMTHAGAAGSTAQQIAEVLHLGLPQVRRHAARGGLARVLDSRNRTEVDAATGEETISVQMEVANAPWVQRGYRIKRPYVEALHRHYDTDVKLVDFETAPESARKAINHWVRRETREKIKEAAEPPGITYLAAGTPVVWVVDPGARTLTVHRSGRSPIVLGAEDRISLEPVHVRRFVDLVALLGV